MANSFVEIHFLWVYVHVCVCVTLLKKCKSYTWIQSPCKSTLEFGRPQGHPWVQWFTGRIPRTQESHHTPGYSFCRARVQIKLRTGKKAQVGVQEGVGMSCHISSPSWVVQTALTDTRGCDNAIEYSQPGRLHLSRGQTNTKWLQAPTKSFMSSTSLTQTVLHLS